MNTGVLEKTSDKPVLIVLVMLLTLFVGLLIGVATEKYVVHGAVSTSEGQTAASRSPAGGTMQIPTPDTLFPGAEDAWDPFREMRDLQAEMDKMFQRSISRFQGSPLMDPFKNDTGYSLSLDVRELKDRYEVRAYLPDAKAMDAKVKLEGNRLQVEVTNRPLASQQNTNSIVQADEWGHYTQVVELAGKLNSAQMKVEHKDHELLITIPKA
ncbi:MAG: Hsp20 family protein [Verrucomicrobiota bacterium]